MIETVIKEIEVCEEKALKIREEAELYATNLAKKSEEDCLLKISSAEEKVKEDKKAGKALSGLEADRLYGETISSAKEEAEALLRSVEDKIAKIGKNIAESIVNGNR